MNESFFERLTAAFLDQAIWYFLWTIPFFLIFWVVGKRYFANRRIQPVQRANTRQYLDEIRHSLVFVMMYAVADLWLLHGSSGAADTGGLFKIYTDISQHGGLPYAVFTCFVLFVIDDTWFYWMHRTIHHPQIYKHVHKVHHESVDTTPFTAYRFHPAEGVLEMGSAVLVIGYAALVPVHLGAIIAWQIGAIAFNVIGHMGYEIYPSWWTNHWLLKWKTPSTHHNMHHERFDGNYGLYFLWWDRIMNTEIRDYEATYRSLFRRGKAEIEDDDAFKPMRIAAIKPETAAAYSIYFDEFPDEFYAYKPGQHITLRIPVGDETLYRTFSLASTPTLERQLRLVIKRAGRITNLLPDQFRSGDELSARRPGGSFTLSPNPARSRRFLMVAGGSGITPVFSMIRALIHYEPNSHTRLVYANRNPNSVILAGELSELQRRFPARLTIIHQYSQIEGRLTVDKLTGLMADQHFDEHYVCGPAGLQTVATDAFTAVSVDPRTVHREAYNDSTNEPAGFPTQAVVAQAQVTITGRVHSVPVHQAETLLDAALRAGVSVPYSCRAGRCGTCRAICTAGQVTMNEAQTYLTSQAIEQGQILLCQSKARSEQVAVKVS